MIRLINRGYAIQVSAGAVTTDELDFFICYVNANGKSGNTAGNTSGTTTIKMLESNGSTDAPSIDYLCIYNKDTVSHDVTISVFIEGVKYLLCIDTVAAGQKLEFIESVGWKVS